MIELIFLDTSAISCGKYSAVFFVSDSYNLLWTDEQSLCASRCLFDDHVIFLPSDREQCFTSDSYSDSHNLFEQWLQAYLLLSI